MKILVACEESQAVTEQLINRGHNAMSCDLDYYGAKGFPPCTFMSKAGARWMFPTAGKICDKRLAKAMEAKEFFMKMINAPIKYIAVENPTPLKVIGLPKHTQALQPYEYGHPYSKRTLLWLKNLEPLKPTEIIEDYKPYLPSNTGGKKRGQSYNRGVSKNAKESSKTFKGIAKAMAEQWTNKIN